MRRLLVWTSLVALGGACADDTGRHGLGRPADPAALQRALDDLAGVEPAKVGGMLVAAVLAQCGDDCACLVPVGGVRACPAANDAVPPQWPPMEIAGRYLAEQATRARGPGYARMLAALADVRVPIPRVDPSRWAVPTAQHHRPLSIATALVGLTHDAPPVVARMPVARFDARGARIEDDPGDVQVGRDDFRTALARACGAGDPAPIDPDLPPVMITIDGRVDEPADGARPIVAAAGEVDLYGILDALHQRGGTIAVRAGSQVHELPIAFRDGVAPGGGPPLSLVITSGEVLLVASDRDWRWPNDDGRYDVAAVLAAMREAGAGARTDVSISFQAGTAADLVRALDLALDAGADTVHVSATPPPPAPPPSSRYYVPGSHPSGGLRLRQAVAPTVRMGTPIVVGDYDKLILRRYLRRNLPKLSYCYEKELLTKPALAGTIATAFTITPDGTVANMRADGVDGSVSSCVSLVIQSIDFAPPAGGATVVVSWPFIFRPGPP